MTLEADDALPISALAHLLYCERRAALVHVVGAWADNVHTVAGNILHERIDSGETSSKPGLRVLRSVHVRSERLKLVGIIDALEVSENPHGRSFYPIETKSGRRHKWSSDEVQLCAQAICVEEMTGASVKEGAIFHNGSKRRRVVHLDAKLRERTERAAERLHALIRDREVPPPVNDARCPGCSLNACCQPGAYLPKGSLEAKLREAFE